jgi:hypothetical protein
MLCLIIIAAVLIGIVVGAVIEHFFGEPKTVKYITKCENCTKQTFTDWLENEAEDCGMCDPPLEAQKAIQFLRDYLLDEEWYVVAPESTKQVNTAIVHDILLKYSKDFRKEWKNYLKNQRRRVY